MVLEELMLFLRANKIDINVFFTTYKVDSQFYHFMNFFTLVYGLNILVEKGKITTHKDNHLVCVAVMPTYLENVAHTIIRCINYCNKPF